MHRNKTNTCWFAFSYFLTAWLYQNYIFPGMRSMLMLEPWFVFLLCQLCWDDLYPDVDQTEIKSVPKYPSHFREQS